MLSGVFRPCGSGGNFSHVWRTNVRDVVAAPQTLKLWSRRDGALIEPLWFDDLTIFVSNIIKFQPPIR